MASPQKYSHIDFTPPAGARKQAEQGLKLRREHGRGGTAVGIARARDISNGVELSPSTVRRMKAFFDRHASDSKAEGFRRGEKGWPSNGVIANKLWGGPAGYAWAKKIVAQMEAADARSTYSLDAETSTLEAGTDKRSTVIPNVERRFLGNFSEADASDPDLLKVEERADPATGKKQTYLVGYAARFGKNSLLLGDFVERIAPTAFEIVEKRQDADGKPLETRCLFNHSPDNLLGRFPTTMRMWVDERGLRYECLLPETRRDIAELVARGDLKGSSFSFVVAEGGEKWTTEEGRSTRLVTRIKSLLDCGPVTYPAYDSATVAVAKRSYDQFVAGKSPTPVVEKRDSGIAARVAEEARKTEEFLADRRGFCATGPGGGIDNSCGREGGAGGESKESPRGEGKAFASKTKVKTKTKTKAKAKEEPDVEEVNDEKTDDPDNPTILGHTALGAALGAGVGVVGGPAGVAVGAAIGAGVGAAQGVANKIRYKIGKATNKIIRKGQKAVGNVVLGKKKRSVDLQEFIDESNAFLAERRGFCATGEGGGIDNSCGNDGDAAGSKGKPQGGDKKPSESTKEDEKSPSKQEPPFYVMQQWLDRIEKEDEKVPSKQEPPFYVLQQWLDRIEKEEAENPSPKKQTGGDSKEGEKSSSKKGSTLSVLKKWMSSVAKEGGKLSSKKGEALSLLKKWVGRVTQKRGDSKRSYEELVAFLAERRGFCPTGEGGGIDNSCGAGGGGGKGAGGGESSEGPKKTPPKGGSKQKSDGPITGRTPSSKVPLSIQAMKDLGALAKKKSSDGAKSGDSEKYKKSDDEDTDWLGRKTGKGPNWLGNDPKKTMEKIAESGGKVDGQLSGFKVQPKMGYDSGKKSGESLEWKKGEDHKSPAKTKEAQDFLDRAREGQLARGGKDGGKTDDGGGVQTWSKGDHFPWTTKQVGTDKGYIQGQHPDGSKTAKYPFEGDPSEAHKKVIEEIKSKKKDKRSVTLAEMTTFLMERAV